MATIKSPLSISNSNGYGALNGIAVEDRTGLVCAVAIGDVPELDAEAMARLIVAAPDMLKALNELASRLGPRWFLEQNWADPLDAIAKAEGRS